MGGRSCGIPRPNCGNCCASVVEYLFDASSSADIAEEEWPHAASELAGYRLVCLRCETVYTHLIQRLP